MKTKKSSKFVISFRVNNDERDALLELARNSELSLSQLMRKTLDLPNNYLPVD